MKRILVMKVDPEGKPRAWASASTVEAARAEAERQLLLYREKKREVGDFYLADANYTEQVHDVTREYVGDDL